MLTQDDPNLKQHLDGLVQLLELKNERKVFYTPFSTQVSPYLKYGRRLDKLKIIEAIDRRLSSCDDDENGFINRNHLKTILEQELKIKDKIVRELVEKFGANEMDWNLNHHVMKMKIDFLVMLRKLILNVPQH